METALAIALLAAIIGGPRRLERKIDKAAADYKADLRAMKADITASLETMEASLATDLRIMTADRDRRARTVQPQASAGP